MGNRHTQMEDVDPSWLKAAAKHLGVTGKGLSALLGVGKSSFSNWYRKGRMPMQHKATLDKMLAGEYLPVPLASAGNKPRGRPKNEPVKHERIHHHVPAQAARLAIEVPVDKVAYLVLMVKDLGGHILGMEA